MKEKITRSKIINDSVFKLEIIEKFKQILLIILLFTIAFYVIGLYPKAVISELINQITTDKLSGIIITVLISIISYEIYNEVKKEKRKLVIYLKVLLGKFSVYQYKVGDVEEKEMGKNKIYYIKFIGENKNFSWTSDKRFNIGEVYWVVQLNDCIVQLYNQNNFELSTKRVIDRCGISGNCIKYK